MQSIFVNSSRTRKLAIRMIKQNQNKIGGVDGVSTNHGGIAVSFESLFKIDPRLREYPSILNYYSIPPLEQITLLEFETLGLDRLTVLLAIDSARIRAKTDADILKLIDPIITKHLELKRNAAIGTKLGMSLYSQRQRDHYSHFILRLAYCKTPDLQAWFIKQESLLFRFRFLAAGPDEKEFLITHQAKLDLKPCNIDAVVDSLINQKYGFDNNKALNMIRAVYGDCQRFYKVPFEHACDLIGKRSVICVGGDAYVSEADQVVLAVNHFRLHLKKQLDLTAKALPRLDEDDRLMPLLFSLATQSLSKEYMLGNEGQKNEVRAGDIAKLVPHFPPCMRNLQSNLTQNAHLKHNARIQYGLFLKGIGLSMEEALIFWRTSFSKMNDDEFNKKGYAYNIRYNYGMEGKRTNYTPYSCMKMITSLPGPGESHGCPFRYFSNEKLSEMMGEMGLDLPETNAVVTKAKEGHYQIACTKLFELTRGKVHAQAEVARKAKSASNNASDEGITFGNEVSIDSEGNFMLLEPIDHPNKFFDLSFKGKSRGGASMLEIADHMDVDE